VILCDFVCFVRFTREQVAELVATCSRHRVHLISDEVYASCVFDSEMIGVLNFCNSPQDFDYVHVVTGLAKLGWSGAKIGFLYSENPALVKTMRAMSRLAPVATPGAVAAARMLNADENVLDSLLAQNAALLRNQYFHVVAQLDKARIPYLCAQGGLTMVLDLRVSLKENKTQSVLKFCFVLF
jgi:1-aminocyclopropane-1-carboxylate synthase